LVSPKVTYNDIKKWQESLPFFENGRKICYKMIELNFYQGSSFGSRFPAIFFNSMKFPAIFLIQYLFLELVGFPQSHSQ
jgi:hypothetical protein